MKPTGKFTISTGTKEPCLAVSHYDLECLKKIVDVAPKEAQWFFRVEKVDDNGRPTYRLYEMIIPEQFVSTAEVESDDEMMMNLYKAVRASLDEEDQAVPEQTNAKLKTLNCWCHSHHNMGVTPSPQDNKQFEKQCRLAAQQKIYDPQIMLIHNKKGEYYCRVWDARLALVFENLKFEVETTEDLNWIAEAAKEKFKERVSTIYQCGQNRFGSHYNGKGRKPGGWQRNGSRNSGTSYLDWGGGYYRGASSPLEDAQGEGLPFGANEDTIPNGGLIDSRGRWVGGSKEEDDTPQPIDYLPSVVDRVKKGKDGKPIAVKKAQAKAEATNLKKLPRLKKLQKLKSKIDDIQEEINNKRDSSEAEEALVALTTEFLNPAEFLYFRSIYEDSEKDTRTFEKEAIAFDMKDPADEVCFNLNKEQFGDFLHGLSLFTEEVIQAMAYAIMLNKASCQQSARLLLDEYFKWYYAQQSEKEEQEQKEAKENYTTSQALKDARENDKQQSELTLTGEAAGGHGEGGI